MFRANAIARAIVVQSLQRFQAAGITVKPLGRRGESVSVMAPQGSDYVGQWLSHKGPCQRGRIDRVSVVML